LKPLIHLATLDVSTSFVTDLDLIWLGHLQSLTLLRLSECNRISGHFLRKLRKCTSLVNLYLDGCSNLQVNENFQYLAELTSLQLLHLSRTNATDASMGQLTTLVNLQTLYMQEIDFLTDVAMTHMQHLVSLRFLDISSCTLITDVGIERLSVLTNLRTLHLIRCHRIYTRGIASLDNITVCQ